MPYLWVTLVGLFLLMESDNDIRLNSLTHDLLKKFDKGKLYSITANVLTGNSLMCFHRVYTVFRGTIQSCLANCS